MKRTKRTRTQRLVVDTVKAVNALAQRGELTNAEAAQLLLLIEILGTIRAIERSIGAVVNPVDRRG